MQAGFIPGADRRGAAARALTLAALSVVAVLPAGARAELIRPHDATHVVTPAHPPAPTPAPAPVPNAGPGPSGGSTQSTAPVRSSGSADRPLPDVPPEPPHSDPEGAWNAAADALEFRSTGGSFFSLKGSYALEERIHDANRDLGPWNPKLESKWSYEARRDFLAAAVQVMSTALLRIEADYQKEGYDPQEEELGQPGNEDFDLAARADAAIAFQNMMEAGKQYADRREIAYFDWMAARDNVLRNNASERANLADELATAMGYGEPSTYYTDVTDQADSGPTSEDLLPGPDWAMLNWQVEDPGGANGTR